MPRLLRHPLPWLAGFILAANLYLVPSLASSPRATDVASLGLGIWILLRLARGQQAILPLAVLALTALLPLGWVVASFLIDDGATLPQALRWLLAVPWAAALLVLLRDDDRKQSFAWGLVWGCAVNIGVFLLQIVGLESQLRMVGLSSSTSAYHHYVYHVIRLPGLHGHHNSSSSVVSLLAPITLYLYFRHRHSLLVPLAGLAGLLFVLNLTSTRGPLVVTVLTIGYAFVAARAFGRGVVIGTVLLALVVPLITVYGPPGGWSRWQDTTAMEVNIGERLDSYIGTVNLSIDHPQGLGVTRGKQMLYDHYGSQATHNAFLQAALFLGLPLGLLIALVLPLVAVRGLGGRDGPFFLEGLIACHLIGLFLFEEHLNNPTFVILTAWLLVAVIRGRGTDAEAVDEAAASR